MSTWEQPHYGHPSPVAVPPDVSAPTRTATLAKAQANTKLAVLSVLADGGCPLGWDDLPAGATLSTPDTMTYSCPGELWKARVTYTYDGDDNPTKMVFEWSDDNGSTWTPLLTPNGDYVRTLTFDGSGDYTGSTWGSTP